MSAMLVVYAALQAGRGDDGPPLDYRPLARPALRPLGILAAPAIVLAIIFACACQ